MVSSLVLVLMLHHAEGLQPSTEVGRREALVGMVLVPVPARALVKGSTPPKKKSTVEKRTCKSVDECEEIGELREAETFQKELPFETTKDGVRYRDVEEGAAPAVAKGDIVNVKYRVMRLGKRSSDNLSGEASPVFSLGYGEDDDDDDDVLTAKVGARELIPALDSAIVGLRTGGKRRLFVVPEKGWKKINAACAADSNSAANSAGGLDAIGQAVVPLATVNDNDACIEDILLPQPRNFGARRRLARRFDEGLLLEVELVNIIPS